MTLLLLLGGAEPAVVVDITGGFAFHAQPTNTLYHAHETGVTLFHSYATDTLYHAYESAGERNTVTVSYNVVDENGNPYVDEAGNFYISLINTGLQVLHTQPTNTLYHAEA